MDIVAVIDNSGSMAGMKIQLVKETLLRLINLCELYIKVEHYFIKTFLSLNMSSHLHSLDIDYRSLTWVMILIHILVINIQWNS